MRVEGGSIIRIVIGLVIAGISLLSYLGSQEYNEVTGENQYISMTVQQEIALGLQAAPELIQQYGGLASQAMNDRINQIGDRIVRESVAADTPWQFEFNVLDDPQTLNAFALPGGQIFITSAMVNRLETDDAIAGVLAHEIVHVLARHSAQQMAQSELTNGLIGAVGVASGDANATQTAAVIGQLINLQYGRDDELESDTLGVCLMLDAGYDPDGLLVVMQTLQQASSGNRPPEFFSTHPNPDNRLERIREQIDRAPQGCPA